MSLLDMILSQKLILVTVGIAGLLIFAALILALIPRIRKSRAEAARRRAEQAQLAAEAAELAEEEAEQAALKAQIVAKQTAKPAEKSPAPAKAAPTTAVAPATQAAPVAATATPDSTASKPGQENASAMQDILSSVFSDEGLSERQSVLLRGLTDVDISNLLTLAQQVTVQVHGGKTITVLDSKEIE